MNKFIRLGIVVGLVVGFSACGDKKESDDKAAEAQKIIQEGMQKEKSMMEGAQKNVEGMEKKAAEAKEEAKK